jgi:hypothetical protein
MLIMPSATSVIFCLMAFRNQRQLDDVHSLRLMFFFSVYNFSVSSMTLFFCSQAIGLGQIMALRCRRRLQRSILCQLRRTPELRALLEPWVLIRTLGLETVLLRQVSALRVSCFHPNIYFVQLS